MKFNYRNLFLALALGTFSLTATSAWAGQTHPMHTGPTLARRQAQTSPMMGKKAKNKIEAISGTIKKSGRQYVLQASNGQQYQLSGASRAKQYVGKSVTVTGKVNASSHLIDVESIRPQ